MVFIVYQTYLTFVCMALLMLPVALYVLEDHFYVYVSHSRAAMSLIYLAYFLGFLLCFRWHADTSVIAMLV